MSQSINIITAWTTYDIYAHTSVVMKAGEAGCQDRR